MRSLVGVAFLWSSAALSCSFVFPFPGDGTREAPRANAENVPTNAEIVIAFPLLDGFETLALRSEDGQRVPVELELGPVQTRIVPLVELEPNTRHTVETTFNDQISGLFEFTTGVFEDLEPPDVPELGPLDWAFEPSMNTGEFFDLSFLFSSCGRFVGPADHYEVRTPTPPFVGNIAGFRLLREADGQVEVADVVLSTMFETELVAESIEHPGAARYAIEAFDLAGNSSRSEFAELVVPGCACVSTPRALPVGFLALLGLLLFRRR